MALNGRRLLDADHSDLRIAELVKRYLAFAATYYSTEGRTSELDVLNCALKPLVKWFDDHLFSTFFSSATVNCLKSSRSRSGSNSLSVFTWSRFV